jgi:RNA 2',3'-cyclic 3'-phosphodiesterase
VRLFAAIEIPNKIRSTLALMLRELRGVAPDAKWVRPENLHVTLKFLGEVDPARLGRIQASLKVIRSSGPLTLDFRGLGFFPNEKRPRVLWAGIDSSTNLRPLAEDIDRSLHEIGFPLEEKPFTPHLTLARFNPPGLPPNLAAAIKPHSSQNFGSLGARQFHLIESKLKPGGAEYTTVQTFPIFAEN